MALRSNDRIILLEKENPKDDIGVFDPGVFTGKNNLHCVLEDGMWKFKYEHGVVPPVLRDRFATFKQARDHAEVYFKQKKIKIVGVKD